MVGFGYNTVSLFATLYRCGCVFDMGFLSNTLLPSIAGIKRYMTFASMVVWV